MTAEEIIKKCKDFYKEHLNSVKDRNSALNDLKKALELKETQSNSSQSVFIQTYHEKEIEIENLLKKHFSKKFIDLYKKEMKVDVDYTKPRSFLKRGDGFWDFVATSLVESSKDREAKYSAQKKHQVNLLEYSHYCLLNNGLDPKIKERDPKKHKRFNLLIKYKTGRIFSEEFTIRITDAELENIFSQYYRNRKPIQLNGKIIPHAKITEVKITTTLLLTNEIVLFLNSKNIHSNNVEELKLNFLHACLNETNKYLPHPDEKVVLKKTHDFHETQIALIGFPKALTLFNDALEKRHDEKLSRNCLDDLRLCLETFLKEKLKNKKSLENQFIALGQYLKSKNENNDIAELLRKVLDFYSKYQNENVKHNDNAKKRDINFILKLTANLIEHLSTI